MAARLHPSIVALCWSVGACSGSAGPGVQTSGAEPVLIASARAPQAPPPKTGPVPTLVISDVSLGANHACALASTGDVWCWGANYANQVMAGHVSAYATPIRIPLPLAATNVAVSAAESCVLLSDGRRACWGSTAEIEYGFEIESSPLFERLVAALPANCGVTDADELVCGGFNRRGVLGFPWDTQSKFEAELPHRVLPLPGRVEQAALAGDLGCALVGPERKLLCWGNGWGCDGPKSVDLPAQVTALSAGGARVCLLTADGDVFQFTELPPPEGQASPLCRDADARQPVTKIAEGATQVGCYAGELWEECSMCSGCIVDRQQQVSCWNEARHGGVIVLDEESLSSAQPNERPPLVFERALVPGVSHPKRIAVGEGFYCALMASGLLQCWGYNGFGQLGRGHDSDVEATPAEPAWPL